MLLGAARGAMLKKTFPWIVFFGVLLLLVFSVSSYVQALDSLLWPIRFGILAGFSVLFVRYWWRRRNDSGNDQVRPADSADDFLSSAIRWFHGDVKHSK
jgi:NhaP-type Na+/H+ or K+/H+ antiporter